VRSITLFFLLFLRFTCPVANAETRRGQWTLPGSESFTTWQSELQAECPRRISTPGQSLNTGAHESSLAPGLHSVLWSLAAQSIVESCWISQPDWPLAPVSFRAACRRPEIAHKYYVDNRYALLCRIWFRGIEL
jgi:hypothetical protein